jgi:tetratricopeptide (TPR) repeat protein
MTTFRWLHLTDFHLGMARLADYWPNIEDKFFSDLTQRLQGSQLDLVLFTGDLVQRGSTEEFEQFELWLQKLWDHFSSIGQSPQLIAVPGNHDLQRPKEDHSHSLTLTNLWTQVSVQADFWKSNSERRTFVCDCFMPYQKWWEKTSIPKPSIIRHGLLPGDLAVTLEKEGVRLGILGLNSAFLHLSDVAEESLAVSLQQAHAACRNSGSEVENPNAEDNLTTWTKQHHANLLLSHHPVEWLAQTARDEFTNNIHQPDYFAAHLFGHRHQSDLGSLSQQGGAARRRYQGSSLFGLENYGDHQQRLHGYALGEIQITSPQQGAIRWQPLKAIRKGDGIYGFERDSDFHYAAQDWTRDETFLLTHPLQTHANSPSSRQANLNPELMKSTAISPSAPFVVPYRPKGSGMVGREMALQQVRQQLQEGKPTHIGQTALFQGIGGLGKTQLAIEYAYRYRDDYPNGVFWLTADEDLDAQLTELAVKAGWTSTSSESKDKLAIALHKLRTSSDCLIIFDNLEEYESISRYLPEPNATPHLLVTSRREQAAFIEVPLELLGDEMAYRLLLQEAGYEPGSSEDKDAARSIVQQLGGLPLALELAGAYLRRRKHCWTSYLGRLQADPLETLSTSQLTSLTRHEADLYRTLRISEAEIADEPHLRTILDVLTWSATSAMGLPLLAALLELSPDELEPALALGVALRLLQQPSDEKRYALHRLVQQVRRHELPLTELTPDADAVAQRLGSWFEAIKDEFAQLPHFEAEIDHLQCWTTQSQNPVSKIRLLWLQAYPLFHRANYRKTLALVEQAMQLAVEAKLPPEPLLAHLENDLASCHYQLGDYQQAIKHSTQALVLRKQLFDTEHPDIARSLANLAAVYSASGNNSKALQLGLESLGIRQKIFGTNHPDVASSLNNLAALYLRSGDKNKALHLCQQGLAIRQKLFGDEHPDIADSFNNLDGCYSALDNHTEAFHFGQQALAMRKKLFGDEHPYIATTLGNLATCHSNLGNNTEALHLGQQALAMRRKLFGEEHPAIANSLHNLATYLDRAGDMSEAITQAKAALTMCRRILGEGHPNTVKTLGFLARMLKRCSRLTEIKPLLDEFKHTLPTQSPARRQVQELYGLLPGFRAVPRLTKPKNRKRK